MKTEDIDKRISMPDVDAQWARFEKEVIDKKTSSPKKIWQAGLSIAASIILAASFFFFNQDVKESKQILSEMERKTVSHEAVSLPSDTLAKLIATTSQTNKRVNPATDIDRKEDNIFDCVEENAVFPGGDDVGQLSGLPSSTNINSKSLNVWFNILSIHRFKYFSTLYTGTITDIII